MSFEVENKVTLYVNGMNDLQRLARELSQCESCLLGCARRVTETRLDVIVTATDRINVSVKGVHEAQKLADELSERVEQYRNILDSIRSASERCADELNRSRTSPVDVTLQS